MRWPARAPVSLHPPPLDFECNKSSCFAYTLYSFISFFVYILESNYGVTGTRGWQGRLRTLARTMHLKVVPLRLKSSAAAARPAP